MDTDGDFRQIIYASNRVCGGPYKTGRADGRKARQAEGPPVIRLAPPCDHGATLETIHAGGAVHNPTPSRAGALGPGFPGPAAHPACTGPALRGPVPLLGAFYMRVQEQLAVRQQARELAGQLRQTMPPRPRGTPQALPVRPPPRVTVTLPSPQPARSATRGRRGRGRRSRGRGLSTPSPAAEGRGVF